MSTDAERSSFACGLGFKCAVESILGTEETFDEAFLTTLEPPTESCSRKRKSEDIAASPSSTVTARKRSRTSLVEPMIVQASSSLNAGLLSLVIDVLDDSEEETESFWSSAIESEDDEVGHREEEEEELDLFFEDDVPDIQIAKEIETEILQAVQNGGQFDAKKYLKYVSCVCDMLEVACVRKFVESRDIPVDVLVHSTLSNPPPSRQEEDWDAMLSRIS